MTVSEGSKIEGTTFTLNEEDARWLYSVVAHQSAGSEKRYEEAEDFSEEQDAYYEMMKTADRILGEMGRSIAARIAEEIRSSGKPFTPLLPSHQRAYLVSKDANGEDEGIVFWKAMTREDVKAAAEHIDGEHTVDFLTFAAFVDEAMSDGETLEEYEERVSTTFGIDLADEGAIG